LRTQEETLATIHEQLKLATKSGATDKVKKLTTSTGINDSSSAWLLQSLIEKGKNLRKKEPGKPALSEAAIQKILEEDLEQGLRKGPINPLIGLPGKCALCQLGLARR
jgi:hypothetical protein